MLNEELSNYELKLNQWLDELKIEKINTEILKASFTHPSFKGMDPNVKDYERLEFLGDAVLDLVSAEDLIKQSKENEGILTEKRKQIVNNDFLAQIFEKLHFHKIIRTAKRYCLSRKDRANFVEAFFGAFFLERGYDFCVDLWHNIQLKMEDLSKSSQEAQLSPEEKNLKKTLQQLYERFDLKPKNAKSLLQELSQKQNQKIPIYENLGKSGPEHAPTFVVKVHLSSGRSALGTGRTKKQAELNAAEHLCDQIFLEYISSG